VEVRLARETRAKDAVGGLGRRELARQVTTRKKVTSLALSHGFDFGVRGRGLGTNLSLVRFVDLSIDGSMIL
jgi:hypothetical protein